MDWYNWNLGTRSMGVPIFAYNINYTPVYKSMKSDYLLATGGPYKYIRHPMYIAKATLVIFFFIAIGNWLSIFGAISWLGLISQAKTNARNKSIISS